MQATESVCYNAFTDSGFLWWFMKIYRVENDKGRGFYQDGFYGKFKPVQYWWDILDKCTDSAIEYFLSVLHPRPSYESQKLVNDNKYVYGFLSTEQLHSWFPDNIITKIKSSGGIIKIYEVPHEYVVLDKNQCVFDISRSIFINEYKV